MVLCDFSPTEPTPGPSVLRKYAKNIGTNQL
jgi:hypothetical protein